MAKPVESWGVGRKDYSQGVESSVEPAIISKETLANYQKKFTIPPNDSNEFSASFDEAHHIYNILVTVDANVLIFIEVSTGDASIIQDRVYQKINQIINASYPVDTITVKVTNYSNKELNCTYCHFGIKGIEDIEQKIIYI